MFLDDLPNVCLSFEEVYDFLNVFITLDVSLCHVLLRDESQCLFDFLVTFAYMLLRILIGTLCRVVKIMALKCCELLTIA